MSRAQAVREAADASRAILELLNIERVVCVDDEYSRQHVDELIAACGDPNDDAIKRMRSFSSLQSDTEPEARRQLARSILTPMETDQQEALYSEYRDKKQDRKEDLQYASLLGEVLGSVAFRGVSLADWKSRKTEYLRTERGRRVAVIFDLDMSGEAGGRDDEGIHLVRDLLLNGENDNTLCGILSHHVKPGDEYDTWLSFSTTHGLNPERFVVMSKCDSTQEPLHVPRALKLVALEPGCRKLALAAAAVLTSAAGGAVDTISKLNPYVFEDIVFRASADEGSWEPDTLFRVYGVIHRKSALDKARTDNNLLEATKDLRRLAPIAAGLPHPLQTKSREILMSECYDESDVINQLNLPPDVGDIYQISRAVAEPLQMVLLNQPCDTAVRSSGERESELKFATLAALEMRTKPVRSSGFCEMLHYSTDPNQRWHASFKTISQIPIWMLDMCTYNNDGIAALDFTLENCPAVVAEGWKLRYKAVRAEAQEFVSAIAALQTGGADHASPEIINLIDRLGLPAMDVTLPATGANRLVLGLRRMRRYCRPWSLAMLQSYSAHLDRPPLPHDLGTPPGE